MWSCAGNDGAIPPNISGRWPGYIISAVWAEPPAMIALARLQRTERHTLVSRKSKNDPVEVMVVNDSPGEECRIAILVDGHLEELYTERTATATSVGNIYKGRVVNVEPAIQAAFIDFGHGQNGFLHISDLHPRYFDGGGERATAPSASAGRYHFAIARQSRKRCAAAMKCWCR